MKLLDYVGLEFLTNRTQGNGAVQELLAKGARVLCLSNCQVSDHLFCLDELMNRLEQSIDVLFVEVGTTLDPESD